MEVIREIKRDPGGKEGVRMKKAFKLSEVGKLSNKELIIFTILFLSVPLLLSLYSNRFRLIMSLILTIAVIYLIFLWKREKRTRKYPYNYFILLSLLLLSFIDIFMLTLINNPIVLSYGIITVIFAYLYISGLLIYYFLNFIFTIGVKKMFPQEGDTKKRQVDEVSLKKLSKYIDLDKQKLYFSLNLINLLIYLIFVFFGMLFLIKHFNVEHMSIIQTFSLWVKKQEYLTLFNGVALLSLMITIYTVTYPIQNKIIKEAKEKFIEKNKEYF